MTSLTELATLVDDAARYAKAIPQITNDLPDFGIDDAYAVQALSVRRRLERGEKRIGVKMGLTSRAKMIQVGVDEVIWGRLTDAMILEEGGELSRNRYVHPRVEPEVAFLIGKPLAGTVTALEAMAAVAGVAPAMEIIDSRYEAFRFALPDVIADNSSSSGLVIGGFVSPSVDIGNLGTVLSANGAVRQIGSTAALLGHPVRSLVAAARMVAQWGETLRPGDIVMAGGITAAHPLTVGEHIRTEIEGLGRVAITVKD
ncbi:2-keto-4-pentenoate hydratase [Zavarzinia aquatilis]|uniref:4-oxalocrotonate decarboxylase n=1 Tax=Zavarzinia aquatilis TaxID=2211142 RepID=A0A317DS68_9PROT|nr:fumarylacetoacetate hydrolase family protein [Zavarzinia aquatilis]PWR17517.1 4-oxalocrotonate decarboxylase [Zavarzinia aquatilis]